MKFFSNVIVALLFTITCSFSATAFAEHKKVDISNHSKKNLYFTVNGQCANSVTVERYQSKELSVAEVKQLCGENATCVFQAHEDSCTGTVAGSMTILPKTVQAQSAPCYKVDAKARGTKIKLVFYVAPCFFMQK